MPNPMPSSDVAPRTSSRVHAGFSLAQSETIAWEGRPSAVGIARQALFADWILGYFVLVIGIEGARAALGASAWSSAFMPLFPGLVVGCVICGLAVTIARSTRYIVTDRRFIIRYGAALPRSLSVPFSQIRSLSLAVGRHGRGDIAFSTKSDLGIQTHKLWPHVRSASRREPRFRDIADASLLATQLTRMLAARDDALIAPPQQSIAA